MYRTIHVPADNSEHSDASVDLAVELGTVFGSSLVGSHVYAAKLHDMRFKQMEFTLPDEYKEEEELEKQRKIHDALIARGLHLISDSYLDKMEERSAEAGLEFERKHFDGRNFEAIADDIETSKYDLVILGALGMGAVKSSQIGSVCERVLRRTHVDTIVVRDCDKRTPAVCGPIVACLDGSENAYGGLQAALALGKKLDKEVIAVAVDDPAHSEAGLLTRHLEQATELARTQGITLTTRLLAGKPRQEITSLAKDVDAWLLVVGRSGLDAAETAEIGSTTEHLLRHGPFNVLVASQTCAPAAELGDEAAA